MTPTPEQLEEAARLAEERQQHRREVGWLEPESDVITRALLHFKAAYEEAVRERDYLKVELTNAQGERDAYWSLHEVAGEWEARAAAAEKRIAELGERLQGEPRSLTGVDSGKTTKTLARAATCPECGKALIVNDERPSVAEKRIAELELRDKMRDDGERHLLGEVEARDAHIQKLEEALRELSECVIHGWWTDPAFARGRNHVRAVEIARRALATEEGA